MIEGEDLELFERSLRAATEQHSGTTLDAAVAELGWTDALSFDPRAAVSCLFELQGEACVTSTALDRVLAFALEHDLDGATSVALPPIGRATAPARLDADRLAVDALALATQPHLLVVAAADGGHVAMVVDASRLDVRVVHGVDPDLGLVQLQGEITAAADVAPVDWAAVVQLGQLALAHELVGASRRSLALARAHALERIQFGQPIARFQAVRHRLAETLVAIETAVAVLDAAWLDPSPVTASMAKASAGRTARTVSKHSQQVLAGIGFTTEHDLHRYVRRMLVLDQLFGSSAVLTKQFGEDLLDTRALPPLLPL